MTFGVQELGSVVGTWLANYPPSPGGWRNLASDGTAWAEEGLRLATDPRAALAALGELADKGTVYGLVRGGGLLLGTPWSGFPPPVDRLLARAYRLGDFPALWAVEGLGHDVAAAYLARRRRPSFLVPSRRGGGELPAESLLMLHAGLGLAVAEKRLDGASATGPPAALERRVETVVRESSELSRPGYRGAALESLGLVSGLFHPTLVSRVDLALGRLEPRVRGFYWHGVGRSLYFRPTGFAPGAYPLAFNTARRIAPDRSAFLNLAAGLAWGATLVNQRSPWLLEELVAGLVAGFGAGFRGGGERSAVWEPGFANGVASAVVMRADTTPGADFIAALCEHRPAARHRAAWHRLVAEPCRLGLESWLPRLRQRRRLGEVFRYHPPGSRSWT